MEKTYTGACHCGAVRFEVPLDLEQGIRKCNCTYCFKTGYRKVFAFGDRLRVLSGEEAIGHYAADPSSWPKGEIDHSFCTRCGTQLFSRGYLEMEPFNGWFHAVNASVLEGVSPEAFDALPVIFEDGLHDRQQEPPVHTRYL